MTIDKIDVEAIIYEALKEKIGSVINYNELHTLIEGVIANRKDEFNSLLNKCLDTVFKDKTFKDVIIDEFRHKVAKNMVAKLEGAIEKNINKFRQDPILNSKMILAIENIIEENDTS